MSDQNKLDILIALTADASPGNPVRYGFNVLSKNIGVSKAELDVLLTELNKARYISQYAKKGVDGFTAIVNQQAFDAVQDNSL